MATKEDGGKLESEGTTQSDKSDELTRIRAAYTLTATSEVEAMQKIMVERFLITLAEVALSVSQREANRETGYGRN
ncbi:MAG: hypothetical protein AAC990_02155 [Dehalococcoides mccartyi]|uniref:hypothetical protein n=1 Tax=Dehalococcoides mccartyi TaxID=61435 RepID=UPI0030F59A43